MSTAVDSRKYLSVGEAAHELRVSKASVYRVIETGNLPAVRPQRLAPCESQGTRSNRSAARGRLARTGTTRASAPSFPLPSAHGETWRLP
jgi:excisionase family DNA binding protein